MLSNQGDILIVDDDTTIVELLVACLSEAGYPISVAYDGASALLAMKLHRPALVLLDLHMPDVTGQDVVAQLWWRGLSDIPVVMMTADTEAAHRVLARGTTECILKPFTLNSIFEAMARYIDHTHGSLHHEIAGGLTSTE